MATQFCQKCKQAHPGRVCDYDEGECAETVVPNQVAEASHAAPKERKVTPENDNRNPQEPLNDRFPDERAPRPPGSHEVR
jgi:hypothetical protein